MTPLVVGKKKKGYIEKGQGPKINKTFDDDEPVTSALPSYFIEEGLN
jgi:hypothetical protein